MSPSRFKEELKRLDKRLDFVWNKQKDLWQVIGFDRRNIKYVIYEIPLGKMDAMIPHIIKTLYETSPIKQGGANAVNRRIDDEIDKEEKLEEKEMRDTIDAASSEAHDHFMRRMHLRISNAGIPEKIVVTDKRRIQLCP